MPPLHCGATFMSTIPSAVRSPGGHHAPPPLRREYWKTWEGPVARRRAPGGHHAPPPLRLTDAADRCLTPGITPLRGATMPPLHCGYPNPGMVVRQQHTPLRGATMPPLHCGGLFDPITTTPLPGAGSGGPPCPPSIAAFISSSQGVHIPRNAPGGHHAPPPLRLDCFTLNRALDVFLGLRGATMPPLHCGDLLAGLMMFGAHMITTPGGHHAPPPLRQDARCYWLLGRYPSGLRGATMPPLHCGCGHRLRYGRELFSCSGGPPCPPSIAARSP